MAEARLALAKAARAPDLTLSAGVKHSREVEAESAVIGLSFPLQVFDRNQGEIEAAEYDLNQTHDARAAAELALRAKLLAARQSLLAAEREAEVLRSE